MKPLLPALLLLSLLPALPAQNVPIDPASGVVADVRLTREQLKELTGPIALYPDPLVAMILPASTFPSDVVLAARFVTSSEDPALADEKPWDESIRGLTRYPDVLTWMDENLEWTTQLGYAYLAQPEDVMTSIQELRAQAESVGNLVSTPQQRIVREETYIRIVPAEPEYIYVPYYDPEIVYYERPVRESYVTFSAPWLVGAWLTFDFDWHRNRLYCGDWHGDWDYHHRSDRHDHRGETLFINNSFTNYEVWQGDARRRMGSARNFEVNRDRLRQSALARPDYFRERFDLNERDRRAVAVKAEIRERDRRDAVGEVDRDRRDRDGDRNRFGADGRIRTQSGDRATLAKIADREKQRVAVETKQREELRTRLAAEGKISRDRDGDRGRDGERGRDGNRIGADGKMRDGERDRDRVGPDGRVTERPAMPGEAPRVGDPRQPGERGKMGDANKDGERERDRERAKGGVPVPSTTPPSVAEEGQPGKMRPEANGNDRGEGKGKGNSDRGPTGRAEPRDIPKAELPNTRPQGGDVPKPGAAPSVPGESGKMRDRANENERSRDGGNDRDRDRGKGRDNPASPRMDAPKAEIPSQRKGENTSPSMTPRPNQDAPKARPQPPVNVEPPKPKAQPLPPSVRPSQPQQEDRKRERDRDSGPSARKSDQGSPNAARQARPTPPAAVAPRPEPPKPRPSAPAASAPRPESPKPRPSAPAASAPRPEPPKPKPSAPAASAPPSVKPQGNAKPGGGGGGKKPRGDGGGDEKKKEKK